MNANLLNGQTIKKTRWVHDSRFDDGPWLELLLTNGMVVTITAEHLGHSGQSHGEYPVVLDLTDADRGYTPIS